MTFSLENPEPHRSSVTFRRIGTTRSRDFLRLSEASEISRRSTASRRDCFARSAWCMRRPNVESNRTSLRPRRITTAVSAWARARSACNCAFRTREPSSSMRARVLGKCAGACIEYRAANFSNSAAHASARAASTRDVLTACEAINSLDARRHLCPRTRPGTKAWIAARTRPMTAPIRTIQGRGDMVERKAVCARFLFAWHRSM